MFSFGIRIAGTAFLGCGGRADPQVLGTMAFGQLQGLAAAAGGGGAAGGAAAK
jgi:hypothetical protein